MRRQSTLADFRRKRTQWSIDQNPTTINVTRTEKVRSGGGFKETTNPLPPYTVRIFISSTSTGADSAVNTPGVLRRTQAFHMLANHEADVKAGPNVSDVFVWEGSKLRIKNVNPIIQSGTVCGYQCILEEVD